MATLYGGASKKYSYAVGTAGTCEGQTGCSGQMPKERGEGILVSIHGEQKIKDVRYETGRENARQVDRIRPHSMTHGERQDSRIQQGNQREDREKEKKLKRRAGEKQ